MTTPEFTSAQQLRLLQDGERTALLRSEPEDQWFDRKSARILPRALADAILAMANAEGGLIVIGIGDDGTVEGISGKDDNGWRQAARDFTSPPVRHRFEVMPCVTSRGEADMLAVIEVEASEDVHRNVKDEVFLRVGDENRKLGAFEAQELVYDKGQSIYDGRPVAASTMTDLDPERIEHYLKRVRARTHATDVLRARGLMTSDAAGDVPTTAGILVLGKSPQRFFPEAYVRVIEYTSSERTVGSRANVRSDRKFEGSLPQQIDASRRYIRTRLGSAIRLGGGGRFARKQVLPQDAWLEALVNGLVHRSYSMAGDHVRVEIFPDRIEVESPGRLPGLVRIDNIRSTRFARNPRIARALADLGYGRELGEGVDRMFEEMRLAGLPDPAYRQHPASVRVTLVADPVIARILAQLPATLVPLYQRIERLGRLTTSEAVDFLGRSRPTVLGYFHDLTTRGLVEHVGSSLKDPRGYWRKVTPEA